MPKTATINARVNEALKADAETILRRIGVSTTDVITMLLHQIVLHQGIPFEVKVPNKETRRAMAELDAVQGKRFAGAAAELLNHLSEPTTKLEPRAKKPAARRV